MEELYQSYAQTVYKFLLAKCGDGDLAEELTQETFFQAVQSIGRFDGSCKVSTWLCQIAKHLWYQHLRKQGRFSGSPLEEETPDTGTPSAEETLLERKAVWTCSASSTDCRSRRRRSSICGRSAD